MSNLLNGLINLQSETGETIFWKDGSLTPVHAKDTHRAMEKRGDGDVVTDTLPADSTFIFSDHTRIERADAKDMVLGIKRYPYQEGKKGKEPELWTLDSIFNKGEKRKSPAELSNRVKNKFKVVGTDPYAEIDMFDAKTDEANKQHRLPYFEGIAALAEAEAFKEETLEDAGTVELIPMFKRGGKPGKRKVRYDDVAKAQGGFFDAISGGLLGSVVGGGANGLLAPIVGDGGAAELGYLEQQIGETQAEQLERIRAFYANQLQGAGQLQGQLQGLQDQYGVNAESLISQQIADQTGLLNNNINTRTDQANGLESLLSGLTNDFASGLTATRNSFLQDQNRFQDQNTVGKVLGLSGQQGPAQREFVGNTNTIAALQDAGNRQRAFLASNRDNILENKLIKTGNPIADVLQRATLLGSSGFTQSNYNPQFDIQAAQLLDGDAQGFVDNDFFNNSNNINFGNSQASGIGNIISGDAQGRAGIAAQGTDFERNDLSSIFGQNLNNANTLFGIRDNIANNQLTGLSNISANGFGANSQLLSDIFNGNSNIATDGFNRNFSIGEPGLNSELNAQLAAIQAQLDAAGIRAGIQSPVEKGLGIAASLFNPFG